MNVKTTIIRFVDITTRAYDKQGNYVQIKNFVIQLSFLVLIVRELFAPHTKLLREIYIEQIMLTESQIKILLSSPQSAPSQVERIFFVSLRTFYVSVRV